MEVKIVFNNDVVSDKFISGWGFSCLVDNRVLFDTGEKAEYLFNKSFIVSKFPVDFDIFSLFSFKKPVCIQYLTRGFLPDIDSICAISAS